MPAAASGPMVTIMDTAAVALALVLTQTVVDSAVVIVAMTTPSALPLGADPFSGNHDSPASVGIKSVLTACLVSSREKRRIRCQ